MSDLISRQAAIEALNDEFTIIGKTNAIVVQDYIRRVNNRLHDLPSAQPEVIRCKDCKHWEYDVIFADGWCRGRHQGNPDWFCANAERRIDERSDKP